MSKPANLEECMTALTEVLPKKEQVEILKASKDDLIMLHHGLGQWIRNNWGLWEDSALKEHMSSLGFKHPDDMSQAIIVEFWNRLNNEESEVKQDAEKSQAYWSKNEA
jgi:hypothetical protein